MNIYHAISEAKNSLNAELRLIASANYASPSVMEAIGGTATNIFSEGGINFRYVGGTESYDNIEKFAINKAKELFRADYANVQPLSGALANYAVYFALLEPGDTVLSMDLSSGGHLSHGAKFNISGKLYSFVHYGVNEEGLIDYDQMEELAKTHKPKMIIAGSSSYPRVIDVGRIKQIADKYGSYLHFDAAHYVGLIASGHYPNPLDNGADTLSFSTYKTLRGPRGGCVLSSKALSKKIENTIFPGIQSGPNEGSILGIAIALDEASQPDFADYISNTLYNAKAMATELDKLGYKILTSGTDTHIVLVDLSRSRSDLAELSGFEVEERCKQSNITLNKNLIPNDKRSPRETSGFRLGLQAMTSRNIGDFEVVKIAEFLDRAITTPIQHIQEREALLQEVKVFCDSFPIILTNMADCI